MIGQKLGSYEVIARLGAGGMGEVFRARDHRLGRDVAIKILPGAFAEDADRVIRFEREARALAALNHPNIATIHGLEEAGLGRTALVMELVEGEDLARRIARGPIAFSDALAIARQIASALEAAHDKGIVHRDLKPANVIVRPDGAVKVIDFGLATMAPVEDGTGATVTAPATERGAVLGTPAYMSPEQARGRPVDKRTDIWAFGALLFELLSRTRAFSGVGASDVLGAVLKSEVDWSRLPPATPPSVRALIQRCLEPDVNERLRDIGEARVVLAAVERGESSATVSRWAGRNRRAIAAGAAAVVIAVIAVAWLYQSGRLGTGLAGDTAGGLSHPRSLAVLPFENRSADPADEYFSDGLTEELLHQLGQSHGLRVAARTSSFSFKGKTVDTKEIASRLGVEAIVTGSVRRSGQDLRITVQLVSADDGRMIWSEQYDRITGDVFKVQDEIARAIAARVDGEKPVTNATGSSASSVTSVAPGGEAFDLYLRGLYQWNRRTEDGARAAVDLFSKAVTLAPSYARAHGSLAVAYAVLGFYDYMPPREAFERARQAARDALALDATQPEGRITLGYVALYHDWDRAIAEREFRQAIAENPRFAVAHQWYANALTVAGRFDEAVASMQKARELDPLAPIGHAALGWVYLYARDYKAAEQQLHRTLDSYPGYFLALLWLGEALEAQGRYDDALEAIEQALKNSPGNLTAEITRIRVLASAGRQREAREALNRLAAMEPARYVPAYPRALAALALGDRQGAYSLLDQAVRDRAHSVAFLQVDPALDRLRADPDFTRLLTAAGRK